MIPGQDGLLRIIVASNVFAVDEDVGHARKENRTQVSRKQVVGREGGDPCHLRWKIKPARRRRVVRESLGGRAVVGVTRAGQ